MRLTFISIAGPEYLSRQKVFTDSVLRHYGNRADVLSFTLDRGAPAGEYLSGFHKEKYLIITSVLASRRIDDPVVFFGCDCEIMSPLYELEIALATHDVVVCPHQPVPFLSRDYCLNNYQAGLANSDMVAFRPSAVAAVDWLHSMTEDPPSGGFYDQNWVTMLPYFFDRVHILRHPGYQMSYWRDEMTKNDLRFMHYSGYIKGMYPRMSKHSDKVATGEILELFKRYDERI